MAEHGGKTAVVVVALLGVAVCWLWSILRGASVEGFIAHKQRVLLVIAHPDDESMFFVPTMLRLAQSCDVFMLCLSSGTLHTHMP